MSRNNTNKKKITKMDAKRILCWVLIGALLFSLVGTLVFSL